MRVALLSCGPSLDLYYDKTPVYSLRIGVNRAAERYRCDVWACTDTKTVMRLRPLGTPSLLTIDATRDSLAGKGWTYEYGVTTHTDIAGETIDNGRHPWTRFTATAALIYAASRGATVIDCYGCDMTGEADWDGRVDKRNWRTDQRWADERNVWDATIEKLRKQGVMVKRWA